MTMNYEAGRRSEPVSIKMNKEKLSLRKTRNNRLPVGQEALFFLKYLADTTVKGIIIIDVNAKIRVFNKIAEELLGIKAEDALGVSIEEVIPNAGLISVLNTGISQNMESFHHKSKLLIASRHPIRDNGVIIGAISKFTSEDRRGLLLNDLKLVHEINHELESIIEACSEAIYVTDERGVGMRANQSLYKLYGWTSADVIGKSMYDMVTEGMVSASATIKVLENKKQVTLIQTQISSGKELLNTGTPIYDETGKICRVVTTIRDVTELNLLQRELRESKEKSKKYYNELMLLREKELIDNDIIASSKEMQDIVDLAARVSKVDSACLLLGESGVGKDVIARFIHANSSRKTNAFIKINCGAIPKELLEAELFGYETGAFTGAKKEGKPGMFELAHEGTLFLDEIGEMPPQLQVKLLQVLQDMTIYRLGGVKSIRVDVRIIAATNRNLDEMIRKGEFREDLFYRLNIVTIEIPPLRKRSEDIPPLIELFLKQLNEKYGSNKTISPVALESMLNYTWPGNVRELRNLIERTVVIGKRNIIGAEDLPEKLAAIHSSLPKKTNKNLKKALEELEKNMLMEAITEHNSLRKVASVLGLDPSTVYRKIKKHDLDVEYTY